MALTGNATWVKKSIEVLNLYLQMHLNYCFDV